MRTINHHRGCATIVYFVATNVFPLPRLTKYNDRMRDRGIVLDPYLDHGVPVKVCEEVGVPVDELDPSSRARAQVGPFGLRCDGQEPKAEYTGPKLVYLFTSTCIWHGAAVSKPEAERSRKTTQSKFIRYACKTNFEVCSIMASGQEDNIDKFGFSHRYTSVNLKMIMRPNK